MLFVDGGNDRVGVGTGTPSSALEIVGASSVPQLTVRSNNATAGNNAGLLLYNTDSSTAASRKVELVLDADGANASGTDYLLIKKEGNNGDATIHQQNNASLVIKTKGTMILSSDDTERVRIHDSGGVMSVVNGIALGVGTANTASNVLDDYEEGVTGDLTLTPASAGSITVASGFRQLAYTKVGRVVHITGLLKMGSGDAAGDVTFPLPFALHDSSDRSEITRGFGYLVNARNANSAGGICFIDVQTAGATTALIVKGTNTANGGKDFNATDIADSGTELSVNFSYLAA
jgi:hypothetical protein